MQNGLLGVGVTSKRFGVVYRIHQA